MLQVQNKIDFQDLKTHLKNIHDLIDWNEVETFQIFQAGCLLFFKNFFRCKKVFKRKYIELNFQYFPNRNFLKFKISLNFQQKGINFYLWQNSSEKELEFLLKSFVQLIELQEEN